MIKTHKAFSVRRLIGLLTIFCMVADPVLAASLSSTALPSGGSVVGGSASITTAANKETINQSSSNAIINWSSGFNIGSNASVQINQPNKNSVLLNRDTNGQNPSQILGHLNSNGVVFLVNSQGIIFGQGSQVNVGGLLATSSDISNSDFMKGNYNFNQPGNPNATVSNAGSIIVQDAGLAALVGPNVDNSGYIQATLGKVQLASGDSFSVDLYGDGLFNLQASDQVKKQIVENSGTIQANGGQVLLTAAAAQGIVNSLINMDGIIQADSIGSQNGKVTLYAEGSNAVQNNVAANKGKKQGSSTVQVSGTISAQGTASGTTGGTVQLLADTVNVQSGATINASGANGGGTVQVGGDTHGGGTTPTADTTTVQSGATILANATDNGNGGNVSVWADNATNFAGSIESKGGAQGGNGGSVETSGEQSITVSGVVDASALNGQTGTWLIDPSSTLTISNNPTSGNNINTAFLDGLINASNANITITSGNASTIGNLNVENSIVKTSGGNASLNLNASGNITLSSNVTITSTHKQLNVTLDANGNITFNSGSAITSNNGDIAIVAGNDFINNAGANVLNAGTGTWLVYSYSPSGDTFDGLNSNNTAVWDTTFGEAFSQTGNRYVFAEQPTLTITSTSDSKTYGTNDAAAVANDYTVSGLEAGVANAFLADTNSTAFSGAPSVTSLGSPALANVSGSPYAITVAQGTLSSLDGYAFTYVSSGKLTVNPATLTYVANDASMTYGGNVPSLSGTVTGFVNGQNLGSATTGTLSFTTLADHNSNVGSYAIDGSGLTADHGNYVFVQAKGNGTALTINPATLTYVANDTSMTYGDNPPALSGTVTGFVNGQNQGSATTGTLSFTTLADHNSNVGWYAIDGSGLTADHGNYVFVQAKGNATALTINPATLTFVANDTSMTYGDNVPTVGGTVTGFVNGQDLASATYGTPFFLAFADRYSNVGSYAIEGFGLISKHGNYVFAEAKGNSTALTINPAVLTVTPDAVSATYNGVALDNAAYSDSTGNYTITGFKNGQNLSSANVQLTGSMAFNGSTTTSVLNAGTYTQDAGTLALTSNHNNYTLSFVNTTPNTYVITPAALTISAVSDSKVYDGTTSSSQTPTYSGLVAADAGDLTGLTQAFASKDVLGANGSTLNVSNYTLTDPNNYTVKLTSATGTITPAALTIAATSDSKVYDGTTSSVQTPTVGTLYSTDTVNGLGQAFASKDVLGANGSTLNVTSYTVNDGNGGKDYTVTLQSAAGTITPAALDVVANNEIKGLGAPTPPLTYVYGPLFGSDTASIFTGGLATVSVDKLPGNYSITQGTLSAGNDYSIVYTPGTLTILSPSSTLNTALLRVAALGNGKVITGTLLAIVPPNPPGGLPGLSPAAGGNLADLSPSAGGNGNVNGTVTALIQCDEVTPCGLNQ